MISPADQGRIQIEITNACPGRCSNCSRFVPHVRRPFFMDATTFRRAVDSMDGYGGMLGIMGGEPTLHPEFDRLVRTYRDRWAGGVIHRSGRAPVRAFGDYYRAALADPTGKRCGLWTSLGPGYARHYELIQDTFDYQCVNTHLAGATHQPLLVTRRELGVEDAEWFALRDACWIQRLWSASINPRGAWFCEIAGALAMLYGDLPDCPGPREGWPIEPGWWRRKPSEFGDQLRWCEVCAAPLGLTPRCDAEGVDDVSPAHAQWLDAVGSPAAARGRCRIVAIRGGPGSPGDPDWYLRAEAKPLRAGGQDALLRVRHLVALTVCVDCAESLQHTLPRNVKHFDRYVVVTTPDDYATQAVAKRAGAVLVVTDACFEGGDAFNKARMLNAGLEALRPDGWTCLLDADILVPAWFGERLRALILNPGCLYYLRRQHLRPAGVRNAFGEHDGFGRFDPRDYLWTGKPESDHAPWGYFQLFHTDAEALAERKPLRFPEIFCSAGNVDTWFQGHWPRDKQVSLTEWDSAWEVIHFEHGPLAARWNGRRPTRGWRYAGQSNIERGRASWPRPCWFRRVNVHTLQTETVRWDAATADPPWITPLDPTALYEFSVRDAD